MDISIENTIKQLVSLPYAQIDQNYGTGKNAVAEQMLRFFMIDNLSSPDVNRFIDESKERLEKLKRAVIPYSLPDEYVFFLETYGGFCLVDEYDVPVFTIAGIGPGMEHLYGDVIEINYEDNEINRLKIGRWDQPLSLIEENENPLSPRLQRFNFYIDLAGNIKKDAILTAGPWDYKKPDKEWKVLAPSFGTWLSKIALNGGPYIIDL